MDDIADHFDAFAFDPLREDEVMAGGVVSLVADRFSVNDKGEIVFDAGDAVNAEGKEPNGEEGENAQDGNEPHCSTEDRSTADDQSLVTTPRLPYPSAIVERSFLDAMGKLGDVPGTGGVVMTELFRGLASTIQWSEQGRHQLERRQEELVRATRSIREDVRDLDKRMTELEGDRYIPPAHRGTVEFVVRFIDWWQSRQDRYFDVVVPIRWTSEEPSSLTKAARQRLPQTEWYVVSVQLLTHAMSMCRSGNYLARDITNAFSSLDPNWSLFLNRWAPENLQLRDISTTTNKSYAFGRDAFERIVYTVRQRYAGEKFPFSAEPTDERFARNNGAKRASDRNANAPGSVYCPERRVAEHPDIAYLWDSRHPDYGKWPLHPKRGWMLYTGGGDDETRPTALRCAWDQKEGGPPDDLPWTITRTSPLGAKTRLPTAKFDEDRFEPFAMQLWDRQVVPIIDPEVILADMDGDEKQRGGKDGDDGDGDRTTIRELNSEEEDDSNFEERYVAVREQDAKRQEERERRKRRREEKASLNRLNTRPRTRQTRFLNEDPVL